MTRMLLLSKESDLATIVECQINAIMPQMIHRCTKSPKKGLDDCPVRKLSQAREMSLMPRSIRLPGLSRPSLSAASAHAGTLKLA